MTARTESYSGCKAGSMLTTFLLGILVTVSAAHAQTFTLLHAFSGTDGDVPESVLTRDTAGNLYGTASSGGDTSKCQGKGCGTVFRVNPVSGRITVLHVFGEGNDGTFPYITGVVLDTAGNLYGATSFGGSGGYGVIYKIDSNRKETILHNFPSGTGDGEAPQEGMLVRDPSGNIYGTTLQGGGTGCRGFGCGTVFRLDSTGHERQLAFNEFEWGPTALLLDSRSRQFYGTTVLSGGNGCGGFGCGTVFTVKNGQLSLLYSFQGAPDGNEPTGTLTLDRSGNIYGTTVMGGNSGACPSAGCGIVFRVDSSGNEKVLHTFSGGDGASPAGGLVFDTQGNLYGTTQGGGARGAGTIFKFAPDGTKPCSTVSKTKRTAASQGRDSP
jgi:uncharacterized repeat protein (TIGR03803 family)